MVLKSSEAMWRNFKRHLVGSSWSSVCESRRFFSFWLTQKHLTIFVSLTIPTTFFNQDSATGFFTISSTIQAFKNILTSALLMNLYLSNADGYASTETHPISVTRSTRNPTQRPLLQMQTATIKGLNILCNLRTSWPYFSFSLKTDRHCWQIVFSIVLNTQNFLSAHVSDSYVLRIDMYIECVKCRMKSTVHLPFTSWMWG